MLCHLFPQALPLLPYRVIGVGSYNVVGPAFDLSYVHHKSLVHGTYCMRIYAYTVIVRIFFCLIVIKELKVSSVGRINVRSYARHPFHPASAPKVQMQHPSAPKSPRKINWNLSSNEVSVPLFPHTPVLLHLPLSLWPQISLMVSFLKDSKYNFTNN